MIYAMAPAPTLHSHMNDLLANTTDLYTKINDLLTNMNDVLASITYVRNGVGLERRSQIHVFWKGVPK